MSKVSNDPKVDLSLLKRLVAELETALDAGTTISNNKTDDNVNDYVVEMSKAYGLAAQISQEAKFLVGDISRIVKYQTAVPATSGKEEDILTALFGGLKGKTGTDDGSN